MPWQIFFFVSTKIENHICKFTNLKEKNNLNVACDLARKTCKISISKLDLLVTQK
jgi:hypothetical protein